MSNPQLDQMMAQAMMGRPTAPTHNRDAVQAQMMQAMQAQQRANDMSYQRPRRQGQYGWGSALTEAIRPFAAKRKMNKANEALAEAMGKQGDLSRHDAAMAEYQAGIKRVQDLEDYAQKKEIDRGYQSQTDNRPDEQRLYEFIMTLPEEQQGRAAEMMGLVTTKAPTHSTQNIAGEVVPTVDGVPQMDAPSYGPTDATIKQDRAAESVRAEKDSGQAVLIEKMRSFSDMLTDDNFSSAVGPWDSNFMSRGLGKLANTKDSQILRKLDRLGGMEVLDLGARVLKGSQTEGEWARVGETMPSDSDHPEVWYSWFDDALKTLMAGAPEMAEQLEPLRKQLYDHAGESDSGWDMKGKYKPYKTAETTIGRFTVTEE